MMHSKKLHLHEFRLALRKFGFEEFFINKYEEFFLNKYDCEVPLITYKCHIKIEIIPFYLMEEIQEPYFVDVNKAAARNHAMKMRRMGLI